MSSVANKTAWILGGHLFVFLSRNPIGEVYNEQAFQCFPADARLIRRPDLAFVRTERLGGVAEEGHIKITPDLAIEVVSPNDKIYDLDEKLADYRTAGVKLVWVVDPKWRSVRIIRADRTVSELFSGDTLSGELVLPGFSVPVDELMPTKI